MIHARTDLAKGVPDRPCIRLVEADAANLAASSRKGDYRLADYGVLMDADGVPVTDIAAEAAARAGVGGNHIGIRRAALAAKGGMATDPQTGIAAIATMGIDLRHEEREALFSGRRQMAAGRLPASAAALRAARNRRHAP